jgi:hypothetical protein
MRWFVWRDGTRVGPLSQADLEALVQAGEVTAAHAVCREGSVTWTPLGLVPELGGQRPDSAPADANPAEAGSDEERAGTDARSFYLARHWRGDLSLPVSYWINGTLVSLLVMALAPAIALVVDFSSAPRVWSLLLALLWVCVVAMSVWQVVGVWRSAGKHTSRGGAAGWSVAARGAIVLGAIQVAAVVATQAVPQVWEFGKLIAGRDPVSGYQIRLLRNASELEVSGYIAFGLTDRVATTLDAYPGVAVIHLNTGGGRVAEARQLRDLIASRHLSTYTSTECASACVIPFLAGERRLIAPEARVGFHQYTLAGRASAQTLADMETDKRYFASRGVSEAFVERAFRATSTLWYPTQEQMLAAGFITGHASVDDVALSGMSLNEIAKVEQTLRQEPLYAAIAEYEPDAYQRIAAAVKEGFQQGQTIAELRTRTVPVIQDIYRKRLPFASDEAVIAFARLRLDQIAVLRADPDKCVAFLFPGGSSGGDFRSALGQELVTREPAVMADVIRSAATGSWRPPVDAEVAPIQAGVFDHLRATCPPGDLEQLAHLDRPGVDPERTCRLCYVFYKAIADLPRDKAGPMLRYTFAGDSR